MSSVLCLAITDNANRTYKTVKSLKSVGIRAKGFIRNRHPFNYPSELHVADLEQIIRYIEAFDTIWLTMGSTFFLKFIPKHKRLIVTHSGTKYRQKPEAYNEMFNQFPNVKHVMITKDLMNLGAKNEVFCSCRIVPDYIKRVVPNGNKRVIAHYPSNPSKKGTEDILKVISELKRERNDFIFRWRATPQPYMANIEDMQRADIYIDQLIAEQNGKPLMQAGNQAFEAVAAGCVVITNMSEHDGEPFEIANNTKELKEKLNYLLNLPKGEFQSLNMKHYKTLMQRHSYEAMGTTIKQILEI
jgi:hypothetical protein